MAQLAPGTVRSAVRVVSVRLAEVAWCDVAFAADLVAGMYQGVRTFTRRHTTGSAGMEMLLVPISNWR